jgi:hypothetical protein
MGVAYDSFSKVTVADWVEFSSLEAGVRLRVVIFPQKLKKSRTSFSLVAEEIPETLTVVDIV